ncbi:MAG: squalene synthase HpnC [Planctomycetia bacterium]|nr:squalene synthase HpnC [Planctomycetia bacterium]
MVLSSGLPLRDLERFGPQNCGSLDGSSLGCALSIKEACEYTKSLTQKHYENFSTVSWLIPAKLRQDFCNIYAYCRWADDLADETTGAASCETSPVWEPEALLDWWEGLLHEMYRPNSTPTHPVFRALKETTERWSIPPAPFEDLLSAFRQDQKVKNYDTRDQLLDYCSRSANPVGRLVLYLANTTDEEAFRLSDSICTGLQLANFWQDVARDWHERSRIYIPAEDRERFGYSEVDFRNETQNENFFALMKEEVDWAESFFTRGKPLLKRLRGRFRMQVRLFHDGGVSVLDAIRKCRCRVWVQRPVVSKWRKLALILRAALSGGF